jgi:hypothetical protein
MNCEFCFLEIVEGAMAQMPCCTRRFHTLCLVKHVVTMDLDHNQITCPCGNNLYTIPYTHESDADDVTPLLENAEIRQEIKQVKNKATDARKKRVALSKLLREKKQMFNQMAEPHLTPLNQIIKTEKALVRENPVYKDYNNAHRAYVRARRHFKQKHNLRWNGMGQIFGWLGQYGNINTSGKYMLSRNFRVRI